MKLVERRELACWIHEHFQISVQRACHLAMLKRSSWYLKSQALDDQRALRMRICDSAMNRPRFSYLRIHGIDLMGHQRRRWHSDDFKAAVIGECMRPCVSIAAFALAY